MVSDLETRITELQQLHSEHHSTPYLFGDVAFVSCDLQALLAADKVVNMVGKIESSHHSQTDSCTAATTDHAHGTSVRDSDIGRSKR